MEIDSQIDKMLSLIDSNGRHFSYLYKMNIESTEDEARIDRLMEEMVSLRLIKKVGNFDTSMNMDIVSLDYEGDRIKENGGWLKFKLQQLSDGEKIHRLLEYMYKTDRDRYDWNLNSLSPAFSNLLDEFELKSLCQILVDNLDVRNNRTKDGYSIGFTEESKSAYITKKYLQIQINKTTVSVQTNIGTIQNNFGTIGGDMKNKSDFRNIKVKEPKKKFFKEIALGIIVAVLSALILFYIFNIK